MTLPLIAHQSNGLTADMQIPLMDCQKLSFRPASSPSIFLRAARRSKLVPRGTGTRTMPGETESHSLPCVLWLRLSARDISAESIESKRDADSVLRNRKQRLRMPRACFCWSLECRTEMVLSCWFRESSSENSSPAICRGSSEEDGDEVFVWLFRLHSSLYVHSFL